MSKLTDLIKAKYPGAYDGYSDDEIDKAWLAKYPDSQDYKDLAGQPSDIGQPTAQPTDKKQPSDISLSIGGPNIFQKAITPILNQENMLTPEMRAALEYKTEPSVTESFSDKMARYGENAGRFVTNKMLGFTSGMSSPLALGLSALSGGSSIAETTGMPNLATALEAPGRLASAGMMGYGLHQIGQGDILPGIATTGLGALGMKSNVGRLGTTLEQAGATIPELGAISQIPEAEPTLASTKLMQALEQSNLGKVKGEWESQLAQERARRFATAEAVTTPGMAGLNEMKGAMSGDYGKPGFAPIQMSQVDTDQLANEIMGNTALSTPEKIRAGVALNKVLNGVIPQNNEIDLLGRVWGRNMVRSLMNRVSGGRQAASLLAQGVDATKSLVTAGHFSAPFRNAVMLAHRGEFWSAFNEMFQAWGSPENALRLNEAIKTLPDYELMKNVGTAITDLKGPLTNREDELRSRIAERIPVYGKYFVKPGNRAYQSFLNTVRASTMQNLITHYADIAESLQRIGAVTPQEAMELNPRTNLVLAQELAEYVNSASGRGSLGTFEKNANGLNMFFMSPRMQAARIQMVKLALGWNTLPQVRKEALKSMATLLSAGLLINGLGYMGGAQITKDPNSADFGKVKIGNVRLDPWAGNQQYVVALARQTPFVGRGGGVTSTTTNRFTPFGKYGGPTRFSSIADFVVNHASPPAKVAYDLLNAKLDKTGQSRFDMGKEAAGMTMPIIGQQIYELSKENPQLLPLAVPSTFGLGVERYGSR
jgi:hypothetical protein